MKLDAYCMTVKRYSLSRMTKVTSLDKFTGLGNEETIKNPASISAMNEGIYMIGKGACKQIE